MKNPLSCILFPLFVLVGLTACQQDSESHALCNCIQTDEQGRWDMHLSPDCMKLCVETFGPDLKGMEQWFKEHCDYSFEHPKTDNKPPTQQAKFL